METTEKKTLGSLDLQNEVKLKDDFRSIIVYCDSCDNIVCGYCLF